MKLINHVKSKLDKTIKYIFETNGQVVEFSYIDNNTGKDIICVPCQTMCNMSCKFCHLTDHIGKIKLQDLFASQIVNGVEHIVKDLQLGKRQILISFMGCGEPLNNIYNILDSMVSLKKIYPTIRFGLATMMPKNSWMEFFQLTKQVKELNINLKIHLSLHFTNDITRNEWMPGALNVEPSLNALNFYKHITGNATEIHYTIMDEINDNNIDVSFLSENINSDTTIKFMMYSERKALVGVNKVKTSKLEEIMLKLKTAGKIVEYYEPPGNDIGASCGQFLLSDLVPSVKNSEILEINKV